MIAVTGGAGYLGVPVVQELRRAGHEVRVLDVLLHGQADVADALETEGVELLRDDIRNARACRRLLRGADTLVHLAAIVGDPACARDPGLAHEVNVEATRGLVTAAREAGITRLVFASTCSNYGRVADPTVPIDESGSLRPVSLYADQKVTIEKELLDGPDGMRPTCLRFATLYGVAPRMRFDLTLNEFTRDLWAGRELAVYGERFWRPYVHVRDAARAVCFVLALPLEAGAPRVLNVGDTRENYRKLDLVQLITRRLGRGRVAYVERQEDPRDYKVSFDTIRSKLGFEPRNSVRDGIDELVAALEDGSFADPFDPRHSNV